MNNATQQGVSALTDDAERNRLLAEMAEQSTDMISRHTPDNWCFIYASPAVTHLLGYSVEEIVGLSAYDLYHPDDVEDFKRRSPNVSYNRGLYTHTYRFRCKDGHYTWLESTSRSIRDPKDGSLKEILVVSRDASRRINAERANQRLAQVLETSSDLVAFVTPCHKITLLNEAARNSLNVVLSDQSPLALEDIFTLTSHEQIKHHGFPAATTNGHWRGEVEMISSHMQRIPVLLEILAHRDLNTETEYFSLVARDMSTIKAAEKQMQQYRTEVNHASRLITIGEMASGLAHELNQPLTAIVNYVQGIHRRVERDQSLLAAELASPLDRIGATALRAAQIIRRMMDFTRKNEPRYQHVQLPELVNDLIGFCSSSIENHRVIVEDKIPADLPGVHADPIQVEQILLNLLLNAIEASHREEPAPPATIQISASELGQDQVIIQILDQGPGIGAEETERIFEQFYTTKKAGLGMGLSITRSLVEAHGGELQAENRSEGGAVFSFSLNKFNARAVDNNP
ncbi:ATP-binding protein [Motiliproteus sp. MSK22-1]|uniref:PAS domain-containing sensor histidine kinase n=1 Tax=Motiliproteus sp. MSK22-1 TaxID=1897630 RepID=UPI0009FA4B56|nr:ATP-binding protein [Motiliproteus sp. MSK22-1]